MGAASSSARSFARVAAQNFGASSRYRSLDRLDGVQPFGEREEALAAQLAAVLWRYAHLAKHEHFNEEREWRMVVSGPQSARKYRVGRQGLTPFLETEEIPLERVWVGPAIGPNRPIANRLASEFLNDHGYERVKVKYWASPFAQR